MFTKKRALLLDMNGTFMFGEDRFGVSEDFSIHYRKIGGTLSQSEINSIIVSVYGYLDERYADAKYRHDFPSVERAIFEVTKRVLPEEEIYKIVDTFAFHELGHIPREYVDALFRLSDSFVLAVVIDIWSPKKAWVETFERLGINTLFSASSFSSDHGMVKPSSKPFEQVRRQLVMKKEACLVVGDSVRRDLGGASAAGLECVLVGGAEDSRAVGCFPSLLALCDEVCGEVSLCKP